MLNSQSEKAGTNYAYKDLLPRTAQNRTAVCSPLAKPAFGIATLHWTDENFEHREAMKGEKYLYAINSL
jgi:hypothetical protein